MVELRLDHCFASRLMVPTEQNTQNDGRFVLAVAKITLERCSGVHKNHFSSKIALHPLRDGFQHNEQKIRGVDPETAAANIFENILTEHPV